VHLVTPAEAVRLLNRVTDHAVLEALMALVAQERAGHAAGDPAA
jgi:hypothetical protein